MNMLHIICMHDFQIRCHYHKVTNITLSPKSLWPVCEKICAQSPFWRIDFSGLTVTLPLGSTLPNPYFHALMSWNSKICFKGLKFQGGFDGTIKIFLGKKRETIWWHSGERSRSFNQTFQKWASRWKITTNTLTFKINYFLSKFTSTKFAV